ncbi:alpha/beta hydrolase [Nocardia neocaledoniensis]|uniref:poly(ethylene terephthalate) hydrolase family protein n=1 Tax=Nocardia neocaledoniensis TaxID=236511 RepID=UPI0024566B25|nr:alpha/beta hydrolase [Nocardia neocaledoniensis]
MRSPTRRARVLSAVVLVVAALLAGLSRATASAEDIGPGTTAQSVFDQPGPHPVATTTVTNPCQESVAGMIAHLTVHLFGNRDDARCTQAFPYGLQSPVGVNTYYPADIGGLDKAPLILFEGGITANPGMYDTLARQWVSHGFVVVIPYDFVNSLAYLPAAGLATAIAQNRDPGSPLFGRIDLSRTVLGGHSAGGGASLQAAALFPPIAEVIDPEFAVIGVLAIEPGPVGIGALIGVPTLFLTGYNDFVVPDFAWVRWWQYNLTFHAPAWIANARGVSHFSPVDGPGAYLSSGTAVAWLKYLAFRDETARRFFVGPDWLLRSDRTYYSVERNPQADALR